MTPGLSWAVATNDPSHLSKDYKMSIMITVQSSTLPNWPHRDWGSSPADTSRPEGAHAPGSVYQHLPSVRYLCTKYRLCTPPRVSAVPGRTEGRTWEPSFSPRTRHTAHTASPTTCPCRHIRSSSRGPRFHKQQSRRQMGQAQRVWAANTCYAMCPRGKGLTTTQKHPPSLSMPET